MRRKLNGCKLEEPEPDVMVWASPAGLTRTTTPTSYQEPCTGAVPMRRQTDRNGRLMVPEWLTSDSALTGRLHRGQAETAMFDFPVGPRYPGPGCVPGHAHARNRLPVQPQAPPPGRGPEHPEHPEHPVHRARMRPPAAACDQEHSESVTISRAMPSRYPADAPAVLRFAPYARYGRSRPADSAEFRRFTE
jgi:hypothetical protein